MLFTQSYRMYVQQPFPHVKVTMLFIRKLSVRRCVNYHAIRTESIGLHFNNPLPRSKL